MPAIRFARNCVTADSVLPAQCECCAGIKLLLVDDRERIRALATVTLEELKAVVAAAEAGKLSPFRTYEVGGESRPSLKH